MPESALTRQQVERELADVRRQLEETRLRLAEAEETLRAIQRGEVDGLVISTPQGERVFTLQGEEHEYRILVEQIQEGAATLSPDGVILFANRRFSEMLGRRPEHVIGSRVTVHFVEADRDRVRGMLDEGLEGNSRGEARLHSENREAIPVFLSFSRVQNATVSIGLVVTDLTPQKQAERALAEANQQLESRVAQRTQELRDSEERLRRVGDNLPESAVYQYVHDTDGTARFTYFSAGVERLNGVRVEDVLRDAGTLHRQIPPAYFDRLIEAERRSARELSDFDMQVPMHRPDGEVRWMRLHARPRRHPDGRVIWDGVQVDITEHRRAEEALRQSEQLLQMALHVGHSFAFEWDPLTDAVRRSESCGPILGLTGDEAVRDAAGQYFQRIHPDDRDRFVASLRALTPQNAEYRTEYRLMRGDGQTVVLEEIGSARFAPDGRMTRLLGTTTDITERKIQEEQRQELLEAERAARTAIERVNRMKDEFLATLSHELRSPLTAILGWTRLLRRSQTADPTRALETIEGSAKTLAQLIDDMLDMGRIMSGKVRLLLVDTDVRELVLRLVDGLRPSIEAKRINLREQYEDDLGLLRCDPERIRQVLANLLTNAIKFTPEEGTITLRLRRRRSRLQIIVRDTGRGIAREFMPHLFGKFIQADPTTTRKHGGLGLGLAIVRQIVELHGGTIRAASPGPDRGAVFVVTLPCTDVAATGGPAVDEDAHGDGMDLAPESRILLVDDDPDALGLLTRILAESGAQVATASSAAEGWEAFRDHPSDVIISDISMPGEDGYTLARRLRALDEPTVRPICIALTALARPEDRERALSAGFDAHLSKLSDPLSIVRTIRELLARRSAVAAASPAAPPPAVAVGTRRILLAEDSSLIADVLKIALEEYGFAVSVAESVAQAVELAREAPPDLVVSDLRLKDGTGWEMLARVRERHAVPAIMMSGYADQAHRAESRKAGFSEYLVKPVDPDLLCQRVVQMLEPT
jgi:PAS domain S-box-containing protein